MKPRGGGTKEKLIFKAGRKPPLRSEDLKRSASFFRSGGMENEKAQKSRSKNNTGAHTQISVRLPNELLEQIETFARADHRSRSNAIECLIRRSIEMF
jgi:hypothetical protein